MWSGDDSGRISISSNSDILRSALLRCFYSEQTCHESSTPSRNLSLSKCVFSSSSKRVMFIFGLLTGGEARGARKKRLGDRCWELPAPASLPSSSSEKHNYGFGKLISELTSG